MRDEVPSFDHYPFCLPAVRHLDRLAFHPKVTFLVGENGSGKSTLLEAVAISAGLNPEGGSRHFHFATKETHSGLERYIRLAKGRDASDSFFLRAESFYNVATQVDQLGMLRPYGGRSLHEQSHGESFFALFENRFYGRGLYLLDEPEAALSPSRQLTFLSLLHQLVREDSQFVIATHSPIIMAYPHAWIYVLKNDCIDRVPYRETEHYKVAKAFLTQTRQMLKVLLEDETPEAS